MANSNLPSLYRQVARVHRRLVLQTLLNWLVWCWAGAILLCAGWFLLQPILLQGPPEWLRWAVAGGLLGLGSVVAIGLVFLKAPSRLNAALSFDSEFGLKERVTTSLTLTPQQKESPAGQALLADVQQKINDLDVGSRFPIRMSWTAALVPVCACLLALVVVFYEPPQTHAKAGPGTDRSQPPPNAADIEKKMKELSRKPIDKTLANRPKSEDLERLEAELEKIANKPRDNKEQIRERVKEMTALEDQMKNKEKEMSDRVRSLKNQLQRLDRMSQKEGEGPAKDLQKALSEGKLDKAREEIDRLRQKLEKQELTEKEKEQLKKQLQDMKDKMERLAQQKDKEQQLKQANLDPETLQREMDQLKKESQKLKDLQELANQLGDCQKALKESDMQGMSQSLSKAADKLKNMEMDEDDLQDLRDQLKRLQDAKDSC